ncbi:aldo/keto reductase [Microlunatus speluncae]|uniref:aldo/keto reductase n=1 Tax=Microlunatus speluncae TaxID=2594267 RepID=UPI001266839B|nr:aldo/keto reductase [Microlunatus speluncae]
MESRDFGRLGTVSALTLGGGGIGAVWGRTSREESVATVRAAIDAGITMLDLAPSYGEGHEAEVVAGEALRQSPASEVLITTKIGLPDDNEDDLPARMRQSLRDSLGRLGRDHLDLFLWHSQLRPADDSATAPNTLGWRRFRDEVVPEFVKLREEGLIRGWGITGVGHPDAVIETLGTEPRPDAAQVVVNALDLSGDMWVFGDSAKPANAEIVAAAGAESVSVIGIRAVSAGSLTDSVDRAVDDDSPVAVDFARAEGFRRVAAELGESAASLAHRYALSVPGVATVVLGVKNRTELAECVAAEARGRLTDAELGLINQVR